MNLLQEISFTIVAHNDSPQKLWARLRDLQLQNACGAGQACFGMWKTFVLLFLIVLNQVCLRRCVSSG